MGDLESLRRTTLAVRAGPVPAPLTTHTCLTQMIASEPELCLSSPSFSDRGKGVCLLRCGRGKVSPHVPHLARELHAAAVFERERNDHCCRPLHLVQMDTPHTTREQVFPVVLQHQAIAGVMIHWEPHRHSRPTKGASKTLLFGPL